MIKSKKKRKLKKEVKIVLGIMLGVVAAVLILSIHKSRTAFNYKKSLDEVVLTIGNCNITLRELSYYIIKTEQDGNERALIYDKNKPTSYWGLYMNDEFKRSGYVSDLAKSSVIDYCVRDNIYYMEASKNGYELPDAEKNEIIYDADVRFEKQTKRERECGLSKEDYELIMVKEATAHYYMLMLAKNDDLNVLEAVTQKYDVGGYAYKSLQKEYPVTINEKIWDNVKVGFVTIN